MSHCEYCTASNERRRIVEALNAEPDLNAKVLSERLGTCYTHTARVRAELERRGCVPLRSARVVRLPIVVGVHTQRQSVRANVVAYRGPGYPIGTGWFGDETRRMA